MYQPKTPEIEQNYFCGQTHEFPKKQRPTKILNKKISFALQT